MSAIEHLEAALTGELDSDTAQWLIDGLRAYTQGQDLEQALGLRGGPGQRSVRDMFKRKRRDMLLLACVEVIGSGRETLERLGRFKKFRYSGWKRCGIPPQATDEQRLLFQTVDSLEALELDIPSRTTMTGILTKTTADLEACA